MTLPGPALGDEHRPVADAAESGPRALDLHRAAADERAPGAVLTLDARLVVGHAGLEGDRPVVLVLGQRGGRRLRGGHHRHPVRATRIVARIARKGVPSSGPPETGPRFAIRRRVAPCPESVRRRCIASADPWGGATTPRAAQWRAGVRRGERSGSGVRVRTAAGRRGAPGRRRGRAAGRPTDPRPGAGSRRSAGAWAASTRSLPPPPPPESSSSGARHALVDSERTNITNSTTPRASATRWRAPKMSMSSSSGDMASTLPRAASVQTGVRYDPQPLMAALPESKLSLTARPTEGSRAVRRLRRKGLVPGVLYGGEGEPETFAVEGRVLRSTLARAGALLEVSIDGGAGTPVIVKDLQRHPVRDEPVHVDLLRVRLDQPIQSTVVARARRHRGGAGRRRGRHPLPGHPPARHRGAAGRHPGRHPPRRVAHADERHGDAPEVIPPAGRHVARRPRGDRGRHGDPADGRARGGGDRDGDRARRRGRGGRGRRGRRRASPPRRPRRPPTTPEGPRRSCGRLADRRPRQPGRRLRRHAAQHGLPRRGGARAPLGLPKPAASTRAS